MLELYTIVSQTRSCHRMEEMLFMSLWFFTFLTYKPLKHQRLPATCWHRKGLTVNLSCEESETKIHFLFVNWRTVSGLKNMGCPGFHSKKKEKKKGTFQRSQKISVSILMLLIIFKYLTACFKLAHPYKMVKILNLGLLTITEMKVIFLKCWAPQKHDHWLWKIHIYWQQLSSKVSV